MNALFCETFDDGTVGGSHACMYNLIRHLDRSEFRCTVGFFGENIYVERYRELGVPVEILPLGRRKIEGGLVSRKAANWYRRAFVEQRFLENFLEDRRFDVVVLNNSIFVSLPFVKACRRLKIPLIVYERGIGRFLRRHIRATEHVQASIPISDAVRNTLVEQGFRTRVIERIYDGIDLSYGRPDRNPAGVKAGLNIPRDARIVGIIGNVRFWKGQEYFIEALAELVRRRDDLYGLVVGGWGTSDEDYRRKLVNLAERYHLADRLLFLGYRIDVPDLLSAFDIFVHASIRPEPFGMVLLEAMAAGVPIVATNMGGPIEILDGGRCGVLVPPRDGRAIAGACSRYLSDTGFAEETASRAYERLTGEFLIDRTVERTTRLIRQVHSAS